MTKIGNVSTGMSNTNNVNEEIIKETYENIENLKESWKEKLADAKELDLFFTTGKLFTNANRDYLKSFVANGGTIRYLCGNPGSDFLEDIAEIESERRGNRDSIHEEYQDVLIILREVLNEAKARAKKAVRIPGKYMWEIAILFSDPRFSWSKKTMRISGVGLNLHFLQKKAEKSLLLTK